MPKHATHSWSLVLFMFLLAGGSTPMMADKPLPALCDLVLEEEQIEMEEFRLDLDLARSGLAAYEEIYQLIEELWENDATERMIYLEARYDRDAARVSLERAVLIVVRQLALIEYYRAACRPPEGSEVGAPAGALREIRSRYVEAHCKSLEKAVEASGIRLTFKRQLAESIHELRDGRVATRPDVILADLAVEQEEKRLEDAKTRTEICRSKRRSR